MAQNNFGQHQKNTFTFFSADSIKITADQYLKSDTLPYLVLIHEQGSSRGEFLEITDRFIKMNFNCLVPDIRNGGNSNFIGNETVKQCRSRKASTATSAIEGDIKSAIKYAQKLSNADVIVLGVGANGSLALKAAKELNDVKAAIALSPGEFFRNDFLIENIISGIEKPLLLTSSNLELPYIKQMVSGVDDSYKTVFAPESGGERGTKALLPNIPDSGEYWMAIMLFIKDLQ